MDDCEDKDYNNGLIDSSSYIICAANLKERNNSKGTADRYSSHPLGRNTHAKRLEEMSSQVSRPTSVLKKSGTILRIQKNQAIDAKIASPIRNIPESICPVKLDSINKLKDSTKKLLCLLEEIQSKTYSRDSHLHQDLNETKFNQASNVIPTVTDGAAPALEKLEAQTKALNTIYIEDEDDDCSIFKRLTRKCNCLNQLEYNDFVIQFNEDTKYFTSTSGEVIKNMRILKKFLYMGGKYTKNALVFLNEGLADLPYVEKLEITQGCSHSDMCNVFEDNSIVSTCISWPCKFEYYGDHITQKLAASFISKLAQLEEGRRYLKFTSKITNDIKKLLRKNGSKLDMDTTESLNTVLDILAPPITSVNDDTNYCRQNNEGFGNETMKALIQYRQYMTLDEIFVHLDLLHNISKEVRGKAELKSSLPCLLLLFKNILKEYDNSEMNIIITNVLNNIVSKNMLEQQEPLPKTLIMAEMATEPIKMRNQVIQMPSILKKTSTKKPNGKTKSYLRQPSRRKDRESPALQNRSRKFGRSCKERRPIIVVPIEKNKDVISKNL